MIDRSLEPLPGGGRTPKSCKSSDWLKSVTRHCISHFLTADWSKTDGADIMLKALRAKFEQVPAFRKLLSENATKKFVEASYHPVWGIGMAFHNKGIEDQSKWTGGNIQGILLSKLLTN